MAPRLPPGTAGEPLGIALGGLDHAPNRSLLFPGRGPSRDHAPKGALLGMAPGLPPGSRREPGTGKGGLTIPNIAQCSGMALQGAMPKQVLCWASPSIKGACPKYPSKAHVLQPPAKVWRMSTPSRK